MPYAECFVLGLLPWVKLQFAPCAVICFVLSLARCIFVHADANGGNYIPEKQRHDCAGVRSAIKLAVRLLMSKKAVLACLAATLPTLIFFVYLALNGAFKWFWLFYIIGNLEHVSVSLGTYLTDIGPYLFSFANLDMFWMASGTASAFIIISLSDIRKSAFRQRGTSSTKCLCQSVFWERVTEHVLTSKNAGIVLLVLFALTSLFSATRTMNLFYHYVNILLPCGVIFVALGLTLTDSRNGKRDQWALVMLLVTSLIYGDKLANYNDISKVQKYGLLRETLI